MHFSLVIGEALSKSERAQVERIIEETFSEVHTIFNNWNPDSELSQLNRMPAHQRVIISPQLLLLLLKVDALFRLSEGRFDPTIEPLQQLWKSHLKRGILPKSEDIHRLLPAIGWEHIHFDQGMFWKDHDLTAIDLGGIVKGYAVDLLTEKLEHQGFSSLYVEWGGEVRTSGLHPSGRQWRVGIPGLSAIEMENGALATSGDYCQCWDIEGVTYFHIIDPQTKQPLTRSSKSIASATVLAPSCTWADGLATILMLFESPEEAQHWAENLYSVQCWIGTRK